jgi:hypothetical protein
MSCAVALAGKGAAACRKFRWNQLKVSQESVDFWHVLDA